MESNISSSEELVGIDEVQKFLNRSRASVYRYTNTDLRNLNPNFNPRKLNPEYRTDQKEPLLFHSNEIARFAKGILDSADRSFNFFPPAEGEDRELEIMLRV